MKGVDGLRFDAIAYSLHVCCTVGQVPDDVYDCYVTAGVSAEPCTARRRRVKVSQGHSTGSRGHDVSRRRRQSANVRERSRMRSVNAAFDRLRALLPPPSPGSPPAPCPRRRGPSKLETLRLAVAYIGSLARLLRAADSVSASPRDSLHDSGDLSDVVVAAAAGRYNGQCQRIKKSFIPYGSNACWIHTITIKYKYELDNKNVKNI